MMFRLRLLCFACIVFAMAGGAFARAGSTTTKSARQDSGSVAESPRAKKKTARLRHKRAVNKSASVRSTARSATRKPAKSAVLKPAAAKRTARTRRSRRHAARYLTSSYATGIADDDDADGEDPIVRQAALDALGNMNGTVVAIDPGNGRILAMVNQKLALSAGAQPCSTIKIPVALAALSEGVISQETQVPLGRHSSMNLSEALARSNNAYFEAVGRRLGFARFSRYARQFGLGELAGYDIEGEHLGAFPRKEIAARRGGVGRMCSFGEGISLTPLQLGALVSAIANGGTLYYLQHPQSPEEIAAFEPRIKRQLEIADIIPELSSGMEGAVQYGTARRLKLNFQEETVLGKTGTCSQAGTRFGWFASYADAAEGPGRIVAVVFLRGGRPTFGPKAAEITGKFYRALYDHDFFNAPPAATSTSSLRGEKEPATSGGPQ